MGIPKEIITDHGSNFMSGILRNVCKVLKIKHLHMTVYHPQTNGLIGRFNGMLKNMLRRCLQAEPHKWELMIPPLLFVVQEAPQSSLGFAPFDLVYAHCLRSLLDWYGKVGRRHY